VDEQVTSQTRIECFTVAGVGSTLYWIVTVDGQDSDASTVTTSYATPNIFGFFPYHGALRRSPFAARLAHVWIISWSAATDGGSSHKINGTNLGYASSDSYLKVRPRP
jgi:hypothetical protein